MTGTWPVRDIIYVAIIGTVLLAACLEWLLWLLAFQYCFYNIFIKADEAKWSTRLLAVTNSIFFLVVRCIFIPVMIVTLPLPEAITQSFPTRLTSFLQWFAFYTFAALLVIPWLICIYQLITHDVGRKQRIKTVLHDNASKIVIVMPCFNEEPDILLRTIDSLANCEYPPSCIHIFLSFDGDKVDELYLNTIDKLGVPSTLQSYPKSIDVVYRQCRITVSRFRHGGKRHCQKETFKLVDRIYEDYLRRHDDMFILFIDSDCILDKFCVQAFLYEMGSKSDGEKTVLAQTGVITSTTQRNSILTLLQDMEYVHGQLFERTVESACGAVTCLPGALTILRYTAFRRIAKYYFADKTEYCTDMFDYAKMHLGEDRWLTHLFMISSTRPFQLQMNTGAFCKTEAVQSFKSLLKQRRRWFLGFISNESVMLSDLRLWRRFPFLMMLRLAQDTIRTTSLLFLVMVISLLTTSQKIEDLPVGFIAVSLGLNWALMLYLGLALSRMKLLLFPLMFVLNPFMNWLYLIYGVFTAGRRTWGGPRAEASSPDGNATRVREVGKSESLLPAKRLYGRFTQAEKLPGGWFRQVNDSGVFSRSSRRLQRRHRQSPESSTSVSPCIPRRVESLVKLEEALRYHEQQAGTTPAAETPHEHDITSRQAGQLLPGGILQEYHITSRRPSSVRSAKSQSSVSLHFPVPVRRRASSLEARSARASAELAYESEEVDDKARRHYKRTGRSPLARKSFTKLAADQKTEEEVDITDSRRLSREEVRGRARQRPSTSLNARGRRRLSKQKHASCDKKQSH